MFQSATLKLTAWYLAILMTISITFSIVIYQLNYREISFRLENLQHRLINDYGMPSGSGGGNSGVIIDGVVVPTPMADTDTTDDFDSVLTSESQKAATQMVLSLVYINAVVLVAGGLGSLFLARRTLRPIAEAHEAQGRFTSDASHELRTPLTAMKTELEVNLRDPDLSAEESRELLASNLEEVNKLIQLSEMLLHLARLDHTKLEMTPVNVPAVFNELMKRYANQAKRFDTTIRKKAFALANEPATTELMAILIDNALKYSPAKSTVHIRIFEHHGLVGFEIKNKGDTIPEEKLHKLFERFYRADASRTNGGKNGYGLGLSIAKKIIDVHHGELTVSSGDDFTTFTFYLPNARKSSGKPQN